MMFLQAVREIRPDFNILVSGFKTQLPGNRTGQPAYIALIMLGFIMLLFQASLLRAGLLLLVFW